MQANRALFSNPNCTYSEEDYPGTLIYIPRKDRAGSIPCSWHPTNHRKIMIYFHGIAEDLGDLYNEINFIPEVCNVSVLALEYPGYGVHWDHGICTENLLMEDANHVLNYLLKELLIAPSDLIIYGRSMGTGVAA